MQMYTEWGKIPNANIQLGLNAGKLLRFESLIPHLTL